jgi:hypothetical protein
MKKITVLILMMKIVKLAMKQETKNKFQIPT